MKFHKLTLEGIGSFYERTTLNLDELAESGLFLITGKTGSGKSTLLDAIVYALYGDVAGERDSSTDRVLSYYWDQDYPPEVVLVFSAHHKFYELQRTVTFTKPGRKTPTQSIAQLKMSNTADFSDASETIATGKDVTKEVVRILGLEKSHFLQTVILPQGQIQQFLTAGAGQRHEVLSNLFRAGNFSALEKAAKERASAGKEITKEYTRRLAELLSAAYENLSSIEITGENETAWNAALEDFAAAKDTAALSISTLTKAGQPLFTSTTTILLEESARVTDAAEQAQQRYLVAQKQLTEAENEQRVILEAKQMTEQLDELIGQAGEIEQLDQCNQKALRANAVIDAKQAMQAPHRSAQHQRTSILDCLTQLVNNDTELLVFQERVSALSDMDLQTWLETEESSADLARLRDEMSKQVTDNQRKLETLKANLTLQHDKTEAASAREKQLKLVDAEILKLSENAGTITEALDAQRQKLKEKQTLAGLLTSRQTELKTAQERCDWAKLAEQLAEDLQAATQDVARAQESYDQTQTNAASILQKWSNTAAFRLATRLKAGEPCPVCGSVDHPHPAVEVADSATFEDYQIAAKAAHEAQQDVSDANEQKTELNTRLQTVTDQLQGRDMQSLAAALAQAEGAVSESCAASKQVPELEALISELEQSVTQNQTEHEKLIKQQAGLSAEIKHLHEEIQELAGKIRAELANFAPDADPQNLLDANQLSLDSVKELGKFYDSWLPIRQQWISAQEALRKSVTDNRFKSVAEAEICTKPGQELEADLNKVTAYYNDVKDLRAKLDTDVYRGKATAEPPDLPNLQDACTVSAQEYRSLTQMSASLHSTQTYLDSLTEKYAQIKQEWEEKASEIARYERLSQVFNGENPLKTTLSAYYLSKRLGQVTFVANQLISDISGGYYEIRHNDRYAADRNQKYHGLGIEMYNGAEDKVLPPKSLSGGEKFYCSLAIALALSEVVQRERGGIALENMFIDEGFGSLDNDTREAVMSALHHLQQEGGRCVGIISHVSELQEEIPLQIQVRNYQSGNTTELKPGGKRRVGSYLQINGVDTL